MLTPNEKLAFPIALKWAADKCKKDYWYYVKYVHQGRWIPSKVSVFICNQVQDFLEDPDERILILQVPPQHGKSTAVTETLPSWYLGKNPTKRVIEASYGDDLAQKFGRRNKEKIEQFGKQIFDIELSKKTSSASEFDLSNNVGGMISRGVMSGITGQSADLIIIDDPIKNRQEADSETYRNRLVDEWLNSLNTRLSADGKVILIQTRWHEEDLAGYLLKNEQRKIRLVSLPCEAEENDILGRKVGEALFPEIGKDNIWLAEFKTSYQTAEGNRAWLALYQCRPTALAGNMIKRNYFKYYSNADIYKDGKLMWFDEIIQSWDCTFKDSDGTDYVAGQVWGRRIADYYLLDRVKKRMDIVATMEAIEAMSKKWPKALAKLIEDKANGSAVIRMLRNKIPGMIAVLPIGGKITRVNAVLPAYESGNVFVPTPEECEWINEFIEELVAFPNGSHDDDTDGMSQALNRLIYHTKDRKKPDKIHPEGTIERQAEDYLENLLKKNKRRDML